MRPLHPLLLSGSIAAALVVSAALPANAAADDQGRLDDAMEAFNVQMTDAGWVSQGLPDEAFGDDDDFDDEMSPDDDAFIECLGEAGEMFGTVFDGRAFPGQTARAYSDEFTFSPEPDPSQTTEAFSFDLDAQEEEAGAFAASVDEAGLGTLEDFVAVFGSDRTADCLREGLEADMGDDDDALQSEFELDVSADDDLGIGDQSAGVSFGVSASVMGFPIEFDGSILMARVDRDLVALLYFVSGEPSSGFDPLAELEALAEAVGG